MILSKFFPRDVNFFDLFDKQVDYAVEASQELKNIVTQPVLVSEEAYKKIYDIEHKADDVAHTIIDQLNKTFIAPFDREDIYTLAKEIDNIVDMFNTIVGRLRVYKINGGDKNLAEFASMIEMSVIQISIAVKGLRDTKNAKSILDSCQEVNRLENLGDLARDRVFVELFEHTKDPIMVIKLKEVYEEAETLLDICEDVAHVVESILVKHL